MLSLAELNADLAREKAGDGARGRMLNHRSKYVMGHKKKGPSARRMPSPGPAYLKYFNNAKKKVVVTTKYETLSGLHEVWWTTDGRVHGKDVRNFTTLSEAFAFARKKATALGDWTTLTSNISVGEPNDGSWIVAEGKLRKVY